MSVVSEINRINTNIANAYSKCNEKGATMPQTQNSANLANTIDSISTGGGPVVEKDVNFYDYDGTLLYSYTKTEFLALESMPTNPTHEELTAQGWNWSLNDAKSYVALYNILDISQYYTPTDNKTKIYINIEEKNMCNITVGYALVGSSTIEWGDNQTTILSGNSTSTLVYAQHTYADKGNYVIAITSQTTIYIFSNNINNSVLIGKGSSSTNNNTYLYHKLIKKIIFANNVVLGDNALRGTMYCLENIILPSTATSLGKYSLYGISVKHVSLPSTLTTIDDYGLSNCYKMKSLSIPKSVITIGIYCFYNCPNIKRICIPPLMTEIKNLCFNSCRSLKDLILPSGILTLGSNLMPSTSIEKIVMPNTITDIGSNAVSMTSLYYIDFSSFNSVPTMANNGLGGTDTNGKIIVPDNLYNNFRTATEWIMYRDIMITKSNWDALNS